jgi:hypothetical protein
MAERRAPRGDGRIHTNDHHAHAHGIAYRSRGTWAQFYGCQMKLDVRIEW